MTIRTKTHITHYDLVTLTVDEKPVLFTTATIVEETTWLEAVTEWVRGATGWHGQIVWDIYAPGIVHTEMPRKFSGQTAKGEALDGQFLITQSHIRGVDFDGHGTLTVS